MRERNPAATCGNCPFWNKQKAAPQIRDGLGKCQRTHPTNSGFQVIHKDEWCGEHPEFFKDSIDDT